MVSNEILDFWAGVFSYGTAGEGGSVVPRTKGVLLQRTSQGYHYRKLIKQGSIVLVVIPLSSLLLMLLLIRLNAYLSTLYIPVKSSLLCFY